MEKVNNAKMTTEEKVDYVEKTFPLNPKTDFDRLFTRVRRMKAEKEFEIPMNQRIGFTFSVRTGENLSGISEEAWNMLFAMLSDQLKRQHPDTWRRLFKV